MFQVLLKPGLEKFEHYFTSSFTLVLPKMKDSGINLRKYMKNYMRKTTKP